MKMIKAIKNNRGSAMPLIVVAVFFILGITAALVRNYSFIATARSVRAAMEQTAQTAIVRNNEETYGSKRESFAGAYNVAGMSTAQHIDARGQLQSILNLTAQSADLVKYDSNAEEIYRLKNISLQLQNPPHRQSEQPFAATVKLSLVLPAKYGDAVGSVTVPLAVRAENPNKFS
ncbi:MAG: hypothetical protein RR635_01355 [Oscillospiraceae bacterium]